MFRNTMKKMSEFAADHSFKVLKDCNFIHPSKIENDLCYKLVPCGNAKHLELAKNDVRVSGIITIPELAEKVDWDIGLGIATNPLKVVYSIFEQMGEENLFWEEFESVIDVTASIDPNAIVSAKNVIIGRNTIIQSGAIIRERVIIGDDCVIGNGTVVGAEAFEVNSSDAKPKILKQQGGVRIGNNVEILAKCTIVRSTFGGFTEIDDNVKIDCQVHIAHDCKVGRSTKIAACAEISGRVEIGENCFLGPNCTITNGISIGHNAKVSLGSVVTQAVESNTIVSGNFAVQHDYFIKKMKEMKG